MALEPGVGENAVPVRSAVLGAIVGVLGVLAVFTFSSSLDHLVATPRLYGWTFDVAASDQRSPNCGHSDLGLSHVHGVTAVAAICVVNLQIDGRPTVVWGFQSLRGEVGPEVVAGRAPRTAREIALGAKTSDALGKNIGDTVHVAGPHGTRTYHVVGRIVLPKIVNVQTLADGAVLTGAGVQPIYDANNFRPVPRWKFAPGVNRAAVTRRIAALDGVQAVTRPTVAVEVDRLRQIGWFPATLAALLSVLALLAVGHALVTAVRRRRRELALLKTIGFDRRQVRATVAWQATTLGQSACSGHSRWADRGTAGVEARCQRPRCCHDGDDAHASRCCS